MAFAIAIDEDAIAAFCRRYNVERLSLFGSVLRDDFGDRSDVDVLVEFEHGRVPGLGFFTMQEELGRILRHPVDLSTPQFLGADIRARVVDEAAVIHEQA